MATKTRAKSQTDQGQREQETPLTTSQTCGYILDLLGEEGTLSTEEIILRVGVDYPATEVDEARTTTQRAVIRLDREGLITRRNRADQEAAWELTSRGENTSQNIIAKRVAPLLVSYGRYTWFEATYHLLRPSLGPETGPGGEGKSRFPRMPEPDLRIVFPGGWVRAALTKAMARMDITIRTFDGLRMIPDAVWQRVTCEATLLPADTPLVERVRRPTNIRGQAIGEIVHEALPEGTVLTFRVRLPLSHFDADGLGSTRIVELFEEAGLVGISGAGSGRGGLWGIAELVKVRRFERKPKVAMETELVVEAEAEEGESPNGRSAVLPVG